MQIFDPASNRDGPTHDDCAANTIFDLPDAERGMACYYPAMGAMQGRAMVVLLQNQRASEPCFRVLVWWDARFPIEINKNPTPLHQCSAQQFIDFGAKVQKFLADEQVRLDAAMQKAKEAVE